MSDEIDSLRDSARDLASRLREIVGQRDDSLQWFRAWMPVVTATTRLGSTLSRVAVRLAAHAMDGETEELVSREDRVAVADHLREIADEFPDVADVLFGLHHVDDLTEAMMRDDVARRSASRITSMLGKMVERMVSRLVDVALGTAGDDIGPERVVEFLERFEDFAQSLLDRWVPRGLGMLTSVVSNDEDEDKT